MYVSMLCHVMLCHVILQHNAAFVERRQPTYLLGHVNEIISVLWPWCGPEKHSLGWLGE